MIIFENELLYINGNLYEAKSPMSELACGNYNYSGHFDFCDFLNISCKIGKSLFTCENFNFGTLSKNRIYFSLIK